MPIPARLTIAAPFGRGPEIDLVGGGVQPTDGRRAAVGGEDLAVIGNRAGNAGKSRQGRDVPLAVVIDHLQAIARGVRDEDAAGFGIERGVIEIAVARVRNCDNADLPQRAEHVAARNRGYLGCRVG